MSFDLSKCERNEQGHWLCQTRDGRKARVVCTDLVSANETWLVLVDRDGRELGMRYFPGGQYYANQTSMDDLVNLHRKVKRWANIYPQAANPGYCIQLWETKEAADRDSIHGRVACVPIEWEELS